MADPNIPAGFDPELLKGMSEYARDLAISLPKIIENIQKIVGTATDGGKSVVDFFNNAKSGAEKTGVSFDSFMRIASSAGPAAVDGLKGLASAANSAISAVGGAVGDIGSKVAEIAKYSDSFLNKLVESQGNVSKSTVAMNLLIATAAGTSSEHFKNLIAYSNEATSSLGNQAGVLDKVASKIGLGKSVTDFIRKTAAVTDSISNLEKSLISQMASMGNYNKILAQNGEFSTDILNFTRNYDALIRNMAKEINASTKDFNLFSQVIGKTIPDAISQMSDVGGQKIPSMAKAFLTASGAGYSFAEMNSFIGKSYETLGLSIDQSIERFSKLQAVVDQTGVRRDYIVNANDAIAGSFKLMADGAKGAPQAIGAMYEAMKNNGLSVKANMDLIQSSISGLSNLTNQTGTLSFLSSRTGGPGGLKGAFQMEQMISEGKTTEVLGKIMETLKGEFGGKIYTRQEASKDEFSAQQYARQRALLQSQAFGGLAKNNLEAEAFLKAFQSGNLSSLNFSLKDRESDRYARAGQTRQDVEQGTLNRGYIALQQDAATGQFQAAATTRALLNTDSLRMMSEQGQRDARGASTTLAPGGKLSFQSLRDIKQDDIIKLGLVTSTLPKIFEQIKSHLDKGGTSIADAFKYLLSKLTGSTSTPASSTITYQQVSNQTGKKTTPLQAAKDESSALQYARQKALSQSQTSGAISKPSIGNLGLLENLPKFSAQNASIQLDKATLNIKEAIRQSEVISVEARSREAVVTATAANKGAAGGAVGAGGGGGGGGGGSEDVAGIPVHVHFAVNSLCPTCNNNLVTEQRVSAQTGGKPKEHKH